MKYSIFLCMLLFCSIAITQEVHEQHKKIITYQASDYGIYDEDFLSSEFHREKRQELRNKMPSNSAAVMFTAPIRNRSNDVDFEFHQDPNFYYLTGYREPNGMVIILKDSILFEEEYTNEIILVQPRNPEFELWTGKRLGKDAAKVILNFSTTLDNNELYKLETIFDSLDQIFYTSPKDFNPKDYDKKDLGGLINTFHSFIDKDKSKTKKKFKLPSWMAEMREIKNEDELELLKKAIEITCIAQIELMKNMHQNMTEYQSEAIIEFFFKYHGAEYTGFPSILGSGENSCILHYTENRKPLIDGDLIISDVGAEYHGYSADVTRTIPVNGKFSKEERIIYNIVLEAQQAGIDSCIAGNSFWLPGITAKKIIAQRLIELGIISKESQVKKYFPHGTSHYLGLDVHDVGTYQNLTPGQVITVEPGIYIPANSDCDPKWWNIGVRIEDDILITNSLPNVLSDCVPKTIEEIEKIMEEDHSLIKK